MIAPSPLLVLRGPDGKPIATPRTFPEDVGQKAYHARAGDTFDRALAEKGHCYAPADARAERFNVVCPTRGYEGDSYEELYLVENGKVVARDRTDLFDASVAMRETMWQLALPALGALAAYAAWSNSDRGMAGGVGAVVAGVGVPLLTFGMAWGLGVWGAAAPVLATGYFAWRGYEDGR